TADVPGHRTVDIGVRWIRGSGKKSRSRHDLPALAITALGHVHCPPCALYGMIAPFIEPFDGHNFLVGQRAHFRLACPNRLAVNMNRARAAKAKPTPESRAGQAQIITKMPK